MKRSSFTSLSNLTIFIVLAATGVVPNVLAATPTPTSAVVGTRVYDDCPTSTVSVVNNYPSLISIEDSHLGCTGGGNGFANLHVWRFSQDGSTAASFDNNANFRFSADLKLEGSGNGEGGLEICPWWSPNVGGKFNARVGDGEIACFGGRLPFYSFTVAYGLHYAKGNLIHLEMLYKPHGLSSASPATVEYKLTYLGSSYTSGPLTRALLPKIRRTDCGAS